jgi:hypothetical protein
MESTQEAHHIVDIANGFRLEHPRVFVPWGVTPGELESLFQGLGLRPVGDGFHLPRCTSLGGLSHSLGFRFDRTSGKLSEIGMAVPDVSIEVSYQQVQQHFVGTFGPPNRTLPGEEKEEFPHHIWLLPGVQIEHYVIEHFGPAERVLIIRTDQNF